MRLTIDATSTPAVYGLSDTEPALEIYADETFDTDDGKTVLAGSVARGDFRYRVVGWILDGEIHFPAIPGVYSTEDSLDNQRATYSAYVRIKDRAPIPWLETFRIPPLSQPGQLSTSWQRLRVHQRFSQARPPQAAWQQYVAAAIAAALAELATIQISGVDELVNGEVEVANAAVTAVSRIIPVSIDENVTGTLMVPLGEIIENTSFVIRSTNVGDNGAVAWIMVQ